MLFCVKLLISLEGSHVIRGIIMYSEPVIIAE